MPPIKLIGLIAALSLVACSIEVSEVAPSATTVSTQMPAPYAPTRPPPPWSSLGLTGRLIYTSAAEGIWQLDLATGDSAALFRPPDPNSSWVNSAAASPDGGLIVFAYAPPPQPGEIQFGYTDLYVMPGDGAAAPTPLLERPDPRESYFNPLWSPDGRFVYFAHLDRVDDGGANFIFQYNVERLSYPDGEPEIVAANAYWPRLAEDGSRLAYISVAPDTFENQLVVADADGQNARPFLELANFPAVDAPLFTPDASAILFSAVSRSAPARAPEPSWLDWALGVGTASAHNVPSDWWRLPVGGGTPEQLTQIFGTGLYGDFAPDGRHLAFMSLSGLTVMTPDGQTLTQIHSRGAYGTVDWIP
jgi:Tol biopolymer transport system component